jgi:hypothetical protein
MIAANQVVVTTGEQCRRVRSGRTCPIIETDKATGDKDAHARDGSISDPMRQAC